jgi:tetratricopeptide (TPR) repeat protein
MNLPRPIWPYHFGEHRWDNYLLDLHESLEANAGTSQGILQAQERATEIYREQADELQQQTIQLEAIRDSLDEIQADLRWGFNVVIDRLDRQIAVFSEAVKALDAIHKTLQSPLMTQAKELFDWGEDRFHKGLYDKALDAFLHSEQKNEVNFLLQLRIGTLFLEGRNRDCNVIDLPSAEKHLVLADRYAQAEAKSVPNWREFSGEARYRAGMAAYLIGEQKQQAGDSSAMRACLERAVEHFQRSLQFRDNNCTIYSQAKCHALLGQKQDALALFEMLSDRNRKYLAEVTHDPDFDSIRNDVERVLKQAVENPGPRARRAATRLDDADKLLKWTKQVVSNTASSQIVAFEQSLAEAARRLGSGNVDIEALSDEIIRVYRQLVQLAQDDLQSQRSAIQLQRKATEDRLRDQVRSIQSQIDALMSCKNKSEVSVQEVRKRRIANFPYFGIICTLGPGVIFVSLLANWGRPLSQNDQENFTAISIATVLSFLGFLVVLLVHLKRNQSLQREIEVKSREIADTAKQIPVLSQQLTASEQQLQEFLSGQQLSPAELDLQEFSAWRRTSPEADPRAR